MPSHSPTAEPTAEMSPEAWILHHTFHFRVVVSILCFLFRNGHIFSSAKPRNEMSFVCAHVANKERKQKKKTARSTKGSAQRVCGVPFRVVCAPCTSRMLCFSEGLRMKDRALPPDKTRTTPRPSLVVHPLPTQLDVPMYENSSRTSLRAKQS